MIQLIRPNEDELIATQFVAALLSVSTMTVRRLVDAGKLPKPMKVGRLNRWRLRDVLAAIS